MKLPTQNEIATAIAKHSVLVIAALIASVVVAVNIWAIVSPPTPLSVIDNVRQNSPRK